MKKTKKMGEKILRRLRIATLFLSVFLMQSMVIIAVAKESPAPDGGKLKTSKLVTGTTSLFGDVGSILMIIAPVAGGVFAAWQYFKGMHAEEDELRMVEKAKKRIMVGLIGVFTVGAIMTIVAGYFE